jgi:hypothetical protein
MLQFDDDLEQSSTYSSYGLNVDNPIPTILRFLNEESDRNQNDFRAKERKRISTKEWEEQGQG